MKVLAITTRRLLARTRIDGECWLWTGSTKGKGGYGSLHHCGKTLSVHRLSYELHFGPIPVGASLLHTCDRPRCINPAHLRVGSHTDNMGDKVSKGRQHRPVGVSNGRAKLTEQQVAEIRRRFVARDRQNGARPLAREFGVTHTGLLAIVRGKTWRDAPHSSIV